MFTNPVSDSDPIVVGLITKFTLYTLHTLVCTIATEIKSPPFEVTEMGWGEFEAKMTMHFKDPNEKPVDVLHQLRLYHDPATGTTQPKKVRNGNPLLLYSVSRIRTRICFTFASSKCRFTVFEYIFNPYDMQC